MSDIFCSLVFHKRRRPNFYVKINCFSAFSWSLVFAGQWAVVAA